MNCVPSEGLLYLQLYKASQLVQAYDVARKIVVSCSVEALGRWGLVNIGFAGPSPSLLPFPLYHSHTPPSPPSPPSLFSPLSPSLSSPPLSPLPSLSPPPPLSPPSE